MRWVALFLTLSFARIVICIVSSLKEDQWLLVASHDAQHSSVRARQG